MKCNVLLKAPHNKLNDISNLQFVTRDIKVDSIFYKWGVTEFEDDLGNLDVLKVKRFQNDLVSIYLNLIALLRTFSFHILTAGFWKAKDSRFNEPGTDCYLQTSWNFSIS